VAGHQIDAADRRVMRHEMEAFSPTVGVRKRRGRPRRYVDAAERPRAFERRLRWRSAFVSTWR